MGEGWMHVSCGVHKAKMCINQTLTNSLPLAVSAPAVDYTCQDDGCPQRPSGLKERTTKGNRTVDMYTMALIYSGPLIV